MDRAMTNEKTVTCEACACVAPISSCVKLGDLCFCSKDCSESMAHKKAKKHHNSSSSKKLHVFDWGSYLDSLKTDAVPVTCFKHCVTEGWDDVIIGMKVEVALPKSESIMDEVVHWIANVIRIAGYKVKLRYEGCGSDSSLDFWSSLTSPDVHFVGWCATYKRKLVPPLSIQTRRSDWKDYLLKRITGSRTLPENFYNQFIAHVGDHKFCQGMILEVVDKMCIAAMKVASIIDTIDCRLHLQYEGAGIGGDSNDFWCSKDSSLIHPVGWSSHVGHRLHSSSEYINSCADRYDVSKANPNDCTQDMFTNNPAKKMANVSNPKSAFAVGMKLEAIDPLNLSTICVATVMKVLKDGYLMIGIDGCMDVRHGNDWFCYHSTSPCILPAGFCDMNDIPLTAPKGFVGKFTWKQYLVSTRSKAAPVNLFSSFIPSHTFKKGMKLEAVDLMDPKLICVATVEQVVGRLLRLHFDGWEEAFDQWIDCESPDIYPVGWSELMKYSLEGPKQSAVPEPKNKQK